MRCWQEARKPCALHHVEVCVQGLAAMCMFNPTSTCFLDFQRDHGLHREQRTGQRQVKQSANSLDVKQLDRDRT